MLLTITFDEFKKYVLKETPLEGNKYGIEVGDIIKMISEFEVIEVTNKGICLISFYSWEFTNKWLDNKNWTLIKNKSKMYNLEELNNEEVLVFIENKEQWGKLEETGMFKMTHSFNKMGVYDLWDGTWTYSDGKEIPDCYDEKTILVKFNQIKFKEMEKKNIIGYKLIKAYPGSNPLGTTLSGDSNFSKHPEFYEPVFETVPEFKIGDWLSFKSEMDNKVYTSKLKEWTSHAYCILEDGTQPFKHLIYLSTPKEIKEYENNLLLKEAKKKYPIGTKFKAVRGTHEEHKVIDLSSFRIQSDGAICIEGAGCGTVYFQGTWAEIIKESEITIKGYTAKFTENNSVSFGCQNYSKDFILQLNNCLEKNMFTIFEYNDGRQNLNSKIKELADYFKNK